MTATLRKMECDVGILRAEDTTHSANTTTVGLIIASSPVVTERRRLSLAGCWRGVDVADAGTNDLKFVLQVARRLVTSQRRVLLREEGRRPLPAWSESHPHPP